MKKLYLYPFLNTHLIIHNLSLLTSYFKLLNIQQQQHTRRTKLNENFIFSTETYETENNKDEYTNNLFLLLFF